MNTQNKAVAPINRQIEMILSEFKGLKTDENSLFQQLIFEVEANYDLYEKLFLDVILEQYSSGITEVIEVIQHASIEDLSLNQGKLIKKKCWIDISRLCGKEIVMLTLNRKDLTTLNALIYREGRIIVSAGGLVDPDVPPRQLTEEEIIRGMYDLCGLMDEYNKKFSNPKKAM